MWGTFFFMAKTLEMFDGHGIWFVVFVLPSKGTNISHLGKRNISDSKVPAKGWGYVSSQETTLAPSFLANLAALCAASVFKGTGWAGPSVHTPLAQGSAVSVWKKSPRISCGKNRKKPREGKKTQGVEAEM